MRKVLQVGPFVSRREAASSTSLWSSEKMGRLMFSVLMVCFYGSIEAVDGRR